MAATSLIQRVGFVALIAAAFAVCLVVSPAPAQAQRGFFESIFGSFPTSRQPSYRPSSRDRDRERVYPSSAPERERAAPVDSSRAPASTRKADVAPTSPVLVLGDSMADWLGSGLDDALADAPEFGVVRKHRTYSGLIRYETRADAADWPQVARELIATERPKYIVMMVGLNDRQAIRETPPAQPRPAVETDADKKRAAQTAARAVVAHEFRTERWSELYGARVDETITAMKSAGVPVFWMGLPSVRGQRSTSDMSYLNDIFRERAEKAGITFVDVWDGFVDEAGRFALQGPDFEGQIRRLRASDGVHFTRAGARKLAHFLERELRRAAQPGPIAVALPSGDAPQTPALPKADGLTQRPLAGPVVPLTSPVNPAEDLAGASNARANVAHVTVTRVLVKGEWLDAPAGRADDSAWPHRGVAPLGADPVVATTTLPIPAMEPPPSKTQVATPNVTAPAATPAAAVRRPPRPQTAERSERRDRAPERSSSPFSFFPFFR